MARRLVNRFGKARELDTELLSDIIDGLNSIQKVKMDDRWEFAKIYPRMEEAIGRPQIKSRPWRCQRRGEDRKRSLYSSIF